jgi:hypothetical protein
MPTITVSQGDSIPSLAKDYGFFPDTIWNHGANAGLRAKRKSMNQLFPGDEVFIPDLQKRIETRGTDATHKFKRKGVPARIKMQVLLLGEPRKNEPYVLVIDGKSYSGTLDGEGKFEQVIPPNAKGGQLLLNGGKESIPVNIGYLNPVSEVSGMQQRLNNLGFFCGNEDGDLDDKTKEAVSNFQQRNGLKVTGAPDAATQAKLQELHP